MFGVLRLEAARGPARPPAFGSAAAKARRPALLLEQLQQRSSDPGALVDALVTVALLLEALRHRREREVAGSPKRSRPTRAAPTPWRLGGPHRVGRGDGAVLGVLVVVDEDAVALLLPPLAGREAGARRSTSRASASAARRTSSKLQRARCARTRAGRAFPEVLGHPTKPTSESVWFTIEATSRTCCHLHPGTGSRSTRSSSGCSRSSARTGCGCSSRQARFAIQASAAASRGTTSSAARPDGKRSSTTSIHSGRACGARFW
jgi:hypothetical protein